MHTDVTVVGAGPTGLVLACELALAGVRTRVLERRTEPQRHSRALSLHPPSVELLDQRGLLDRFLPLGRTVPGWHFAGLRTQLDFSALDSRHGYTLFLAQARTEVSQRVYDVLFSSGVGGFLIPDDRLKWILRDIRSSWAASAEREG